MTLITPILEGICHQKVDTSYALST